MSEAATKVRKFLFRDAEGRNVDVVAQLGGHFSITSQNGAAHDSILAAAPADVRNDIETLISVHLNDANGTPMHAIANASYHLISSDFDAATRSLGSVTAVEDLYVVFGNASRQASDPKLLVEYLRKPTELAKKILAMELAVKQGTTTLTRRKEIQEMTETIASLVGRRKIEGKDLADFAAEKFDESTRKAITASIVRKIFHDKVAEFVEEKCRPIWNARVEAANAALSKPDYRVEGRPAIVDDPSTFEGFVAKSGIQMDPGKLTQTSHRRDSQTNPSYAQFKWTVALTKKTADGSPSKTFSLDYFKGNPTPPTIEGVLESLQMEYCSVLTYDRDDWLTEFGYNGDMKKLRAGEAAYDQQRNVEIPRFREVFGDDTLRELLTSVGDNPPIDKEDYDSIANKTAAPSI